MWNKSYLCCLLMQLFFMLSFNMVTPLIAQYVEILGGATTIAGFIAGMFSIMALIYRPFVGFISDRVDKKKLLMIGFFIGAVAVAGYALSVNYIMLGAFRALHALSLCFLTTLTSAMACDYIPESRMAEGIGYIGVSTMIGMSLGPGIGVLISQNVNHQTAFFFGAILIAAGSLFVFGLSASPNQIEAGGGMSLKNLLDIPSLPLTFTMATISYCTGLTSSFLILVGVQRDIGEVVLFFFLSSLGMIVVRPFAGRYTDRHGIKRLGFLAIASEMACMITLVFADSLIWIVVAALFRVFGQGTGQGVLQGQTLKNAPKEARGKVSATFYIGVDFGQGMGAILGGALADYFSYAAAFGSAVPCLLCGSIAMTFWLRRHHQLR